MRSRCGAGQEDLHSFWTEEFEILVNIQAARLRRHRLHGARSGPGHSSRGGGKAVGPDESLQYS